MAQNENLNENEQTVEQQPTAEAEATTETAAAEEQAPQTPEERIAELEAEVDQLKKDALYRVAEFDNYRKRTIKEKAELIKTAAEKTITEILPVLDDMERALKTMETAEDVASVREGVDLIYQKFLKTLGQQGLKSIETQGQDFNVDFHEAIALVPAPNDELKGKVLDCVQTGYTLNDKVIRHAKVAVAQ